MSLLPRAALRSGSEQLSLRQESGGLPLRYKGLQKLVSDIGYRTKVYSDIRYNVGLHPLQSDIGHSDIRLSPISLI